MKRLFIYSMLVAAMAVACTKVDIPNQPDGDESDFILETRSYDELNPEELRVTYPEVYRYVILKARGLAKNWSKQVYAFDERFYPKTGSFEITCYPDPENTAVYIINYPNSWEVVSADKRTSVVLAAGDGRFEFDKVNPNLAACVKDLAAEVAALRHYYGKLRNARENFDVWCAVIEAGDKAFKDFRTTPFLFDPKNALTLMNFNSPTRAGSPLDTTYHPEAGHYELADSFYTYAAVAPRVYPLTTTRWGEMDGYNQYCPINPDTYGHAPAGSEAVAGGQMVYFMHHNADCCPDVYRYASVTSFIGDDAACSGMEQTDKSAANWAFFNSSDSVRMAAVMLANIGKKMDMTYGVRFSYGEFEALKRALLDEYDIESYLVGFSGSEVNPYDEIASMLQDHAMPSIVHSGGSQFTDPHTYIVDGYARSVQYVNRMYRFVPDNLANQPLYSNLYALETAALGPVSMFHMNWGNYGNGNDVWVVDSGDWHVGELDHSNREAMLSFRMDGSEPGGNSGGQR